MAFDSRKAFYDFKKLVTQKRWATSDADLAFLKAIAKTMKEREDVLPKGFQLYRAQMEYDTNLDPELGPVGCYGHDKERMIPKPEYITSDGRCNVAGQAVMYLALSVDGAIFELRPWISQGVSVAKFVCKKELKVLDLTKGHGKPPFLFNAFMKKTASQLGVPPLPPTQDKINEYVWYDIDRSFSRPVATHDQKREYVPTQILFQFFIDFGYDGIIYTSQFGEDRGYNIVLKDPDLVEFKFSSPFDVKGIKFDFEKCEYV